MPRETQIPTRVLDEAFATIREFADRRGVSPDALVSAMQRDDETFLTVMEVASILAVDRRTVGRYRESGELDAVDINPNRTGRPQWRITRASLDAFLVRVRKPRARTKGPIRSPAILERQQKAQNANRRSAGGRKRIRKPSKHLV